ncbi:MAG: class I SAM-dependent methyltransferase [Proteobacteria bacterium]|nr:class I SAM-dependent methyltransferase [Pseudomonadota bacterium]
MKKPSANNIANFISNINYAILKIIGKNLPKHVALNIIQKENNYFLHEKNLILQTDLLKLCHLIFDESSLKTEMKLSDNFSKRIRHAFVFQLAMNAIKKDKGKSSIAECGCFKGQSSYIISKAIMLNGHNNTFHIFDSFEGLSDYSKHDITNLSEEKIQETRKVFAASIDLVKDNLKDFNFIQYHKGWIPSRFNEVEGQKFCFVNIDVDLHDPIKDSLEFFYPRLVSGGSIFLDDYGFNQFPGASTAIDDFIKINKPSYFLALPTGGAFLIK